MIYLDNAATTNKKPKCVLKAICSEIKNSANPGRSSHSLSLKSSLRIYETREMLCKLFNINKPEDFILTPNATYALNFAIKGILNENDHVVTTSMEHNSVLRPLYSIKNLEVTIIKGNSIGLINTDDIINSIKSNTKLIIINHSSNVNGIIQNIDEISKIARKNNIPILIDISQTAGIIEIDLNKFDLAALPGHKSLYGPQGTGALYINDKIKLNTIIEGGTGSESMLLSNPSYYPDRLENGTLNTPGFCGLTQGIKFILKEGIKSIMDYEHSLIKIAIEALANMENIILYSPLDTDLISNSIAFNIKNKDSTAVSQILNDKYNIAVRPGYHCAYLAHKTLGSEKHGSVRVSVSYFNKKKEIFKLINAINNIC